MEESSGNAKVSLQSAAVRNVTAVQLVESSSSRNTVQLVNTDRPQPGNDSMNLVELARQVQKADEFTRATAVSKLSVIAEQIRFLQEQARRVLEEAQCDNDLHHAACNFKKIPGTLYFLYRRQSGQRYWSMISPEEWGSSCPHEYLGAYKLQHDMSWTPESKIQSRTLELETLDKLVDKHFAASSNIMDSQLRDLAAVEYLATTLDPADAGNTLKQNETETASNKTVKNGFSIDISKAPGIAQ